jgi:transposase-like protein
LGMAKPDSITSSSLEDTVLSPLAREDLALEQFKALRWKHGAFCPYCASAQIYHFRDNRTHKCGECRRRFSIKVGTVFEDSKVGLAGWFAAVQLAVEAPQGATPDELSKIIGVSRKTASQMLRRLRVAVLTPSFNRPIQVTGLGDGRPRRSLPASGMLTSASDTQQSGHSE